MSQGRILIIAHFFYPCNVIAAHRPASWAKELVKAGYEVRVLTRQWTGKEQNWEHYLADNLTPASQEMKDGYTIEKIPYRRTWLHRLSQTALFRKLPVLRFGIEVLSSLIGAIDFDRNMTGNYLPAARRIMQDFKPDAILVSAGPYTGLKLASLISAQYQVPWIADFRDVWNMDLLRSDGQMTFRNKLRSIRHNHYIRKWISSAQKVIFVSEGFDQVFATICPSEKIIHVKNGYEANLYGDLSPKQTDRFTILCLGTLYLEQDRSALYGGIRHLLQKHPEARFVLRFLGVEVNPLVSAEIHKNIPKGYVETTAFVPRQQALEETLGAQVLYYPVWNGYRGVYSGKIFEYLGARRNILITPGDGYVLDALLEETQAGVAASDAASCGEILCAWYESWQQSGTLPYHGINEKIEAYTRENQAKKVIEQLKQIIPA